MMPSPMRRALAAKDKNAPLKILSSKALVANTTTANSRNPSSDRPVFRKPSDMAAQLSSSPKAGNKRKIEEVEDAERVNDDVQNNSQKTELLVDSESESEQIDEISTFNFQKSYDTAGTSFSASQNVPEPQFELHQEELSQRTSEKLNAVPMPRNTSQLPPLRPGLRQEVSAGSVGLSSFINFDGVPSTQASDGVEPIPVPEESKPAEKEATSLPATRPKFSEDKLAEMRTRLQLAMYKVQTRQTSQPFSRLKNPRPPPPRGLSPSTPPMLPLPTVTTPPQHSSATVRPPSSGVTIAAAQSYNSAEEQIAAMRAVAYENAPQHPPPRNLNSLPVPRLSPQLPSSPPFSRNQSVDDAFSGAQKDTFMAGGKAPIELSSPPASVEGTCGPGLTKSGDDQAATRLVKLSNAVVAK